MEKATDMQLALFLMEHIDNPCVEPYTGHNIRRFYINEARAALGKLSNPFAHEMLEKKNM